MFIIRIAGKKGVQRLHERKLVTCKSVFMGNPGQRIRRYSA